MPTTNVSCQFNKSTSVFYASSLFSDHELQAYSETLTRRESVRANASLGELRRVQASSGELRRVKEV